MRPAAAYVVAVDDDARRVFFVESYVPQLDARRAREITSRFQWAVRELNDEGVDVRWLRSFVLVGEETFISVVSAPTVEQVDALNVRVDRPDDHVVEVVPLDA